MKTEDLKPTSPEDFESLLRAHNLFREDDITFDDLEEDLFVYTGNDFEIDASVLDSMHIQGLIIVGDLKVDFLDVSSALGDFGVLCVTGDVKCKDMLYMTECTSVCVSGNLTIDEVFYADCGNSGLHVHKKITSKLFYNSQCDVDGEESLQFEFDESVTDEDLVSAFPGVKATDGDDSQYEAIRAYFRERYPEPTSESP